MLIEDPALIEQRCYEGWTPLIIAAAEGHTEMVEWLVNHGGADTEAETLSGESALFWACFRGHSQIFSFLLSKGSNPPNMRGNDLPDGHCNDPFMLAACRGHIEILQLLLSRQDIDIDSTEWDSGPTAIYRAAYSNRSQAVRLLLEAGADPRIPFGERETPLDAATRLGHVECIRLLEVRFVCKSFLFT